MEIFYSIFLVILLFSSVKIIEYKRDKEIKDNMNEKDKELLKKIGFLK